MDYQEFLDRKAQLASGSGFEPEEDAPFLYDFQRALVRWAQVTGRAAIFADCGLGKTPMQLVWADNVRRKTGRPVLIITPLAVGHQTVGEGEKFGIECARSQDGKVAAGITVTNYERLHLFSPDDFAGVVCDESSAIKHFTGATQKKVTRFLTKMPYRLLATATAAPNDYIELGTSSEALGQMNNTDMLTRFFHNNDNTQETMGKWLSHGGSMPKWSLKAHAEEPFWRWVCSWARALRKPSDFGFDDSGFILPPMIEKQTTVKASRNLSGYLFPVPAFGLYEQREERRATINERCEEVAARLEHDKIAVAWCHLNAEGDLLEKIIPGAVQVSGSMSDEAKEEALIAFGLGQVRVLVTKPKIGAFGLNWQHCNHMTFFPSHSYEQYYQAVRRCWRFGQTRPVTIDIVTTEGELDVLNNLKRKAEAADRMFSQLSAHINDELRISRTNQFTKSEEVPQWL